MGLPLIIAGLIFLLNGTTWFDGENNVGKVLLLVGGVLTALHILWFLIVAGVATSDMRGRMGF